MKKLIQKVKAFFVSEQGDISVKGIAITVAIIVIIGFAIGMIQNFLPGWTEQIWDMMIGAVEDFI